MSRICEGGVGGLAVSPLAFGIESPKSVASQFKPGTIRFQASAAGLPSAELALAAAEKP